MTNDIYSDIASRTDGDIYIGVVGPVRTGKSTFIKRFMESLVIPNIESDFKRERAVDELPQSAAGKTIMTTEPKFIPEEAVEVNLGDGARFNVRMIDCVGYIVPSSIGYIENSAPRMVQTPWFEEEVPFNMAAEIGTRKVISEHSTIGLVVTTDGSISDIPRDEYAEVEERVINELNEIDKPFVVIMNCVNPRSEDAKALCSELSEKYSATVIPVNCLELNEQDIRDIITQVLFAFPIKEINIRMEKWITGLEKGHWLKNEVFSAVREAAENVRIVREVKRAAELMGKCQYVVDSRVADMNLGKGSITIQVSLDSSLFYKILGEATGYGIVMPDIDELSLEEPEIIKQGGKYGVKLKASAPSIHLMKAAINTTVSPIVGTEKQSEELVMYLLSGFEENPKKIWESNIFGKSLHELVNEGLHNKLYKMPVEARMKLQETLQRVINEGCSGLICFIL